VWFSKTSLHLWLLGLSACVVVDDVPSDYRGACEFYVERLGSCGFVDEADLEAEATQCTRERKQPDEKVSSACAEAANEVDKCIHSLSCEEIHSDGAVVCEDAYALERDECSDAWTMRPVDTVPR